MNCIGVIINLAIVIKTASYDQRLNNDIFIYEFQMKLWYDCVFFKKEECNIDMSFALSCHILIFKDHKFNTGIWYPFIFVFTMINCGEKEIW